MTKNTRFSLKSVNGRFAWFWKVRANMTHNGQQFVPSLAPVVTGRNQGGPDAGHAPVKSTLIS